MALVPGERQGPILTRRRRRADPGFIEVFDNFAFDEVPGNDRATLVDVLTQLLPYLGHPRTLSGLRCLDEVIPEPR